MHLLLFIILYSHLSFAALEPYSIKKNDVPKMCTIKTGLRITGETTLHLFNIGIGITGIYWGIKTIIDQKDNPDPKQTALAVTGGICSGTSSLISGCYGFYQMCERTEIHKIVLARLRSKKNDTDEVS